MKSKRDRARESMLRAIKFISAQSRHAENDLRARMNQTRGFAGRSADERRVDPTDTHHRSAAPAYPAPETLVRLARRRYRRPAYRDISASVHVHTQLVALVPKSRAIRTPEGFASISV